MSNPATSSVSSRTTAPYAYAYGYLDSTVESWVKNSWFWIEPSAFPNSLSRSALVERLLSLEEIRASIALTVADGVRSSDYRAEYTTLRAITLRMLSGCEKLHDELAITHPLNVVVLRERVEHIRARIAELIAD